MVGSSEQTLTVTLQLTDGKYSSAPAQLTSIGASTDVSEQGTLDGSGQHLTPTTSQAPAPDLLTTQNILSVGNALLGEIIQLELGKDVPASLVAQALASSIITNLQKSNLVLSGISAKSVATDFGVDLAGSVGNYLGGQLGAELARDAGIDPRVGSFVGGAARPSAGDEVAGAGAWEVRDVCLAHGRGQRGRHHLPGGWSGQGNNRCRSRPARRYDRVRSLFRPRQLRRREIASLIDPATTKDAAIGGEVGAVVGATIGQIVIPIPFVGAFIGAFVATCSAPCSGSGSAGRRPTRWRSTKIQLTMDGTFGGIGEITKHLDVFPGIDRTGLMLGQQAASTINAVLAPIGGRVANCSPSKLQLRGCRVPRQLEQDHRLQRRRHQALHRPADGADAWHPRRVAIHPGRGWRQSPSSAPCLLTLTGSTSTVSPTSRPATCSSMVLTDQQLARVYESYCAESAPVRRKPGQCGRYIGAGPTGSASSPVPNSLACRTRRRPTPTARPPT